MCLQHVTDQSSGHTCSRPLTNHTGTDCQHPLWLLPLQYCRLAAIPSAYPLSGPSRAAATSTTRAPGRGLLQVPTSCATQGVLCDQDSATTATILTYTGSGLSYQGTPLVQSPGSATLLLSADPACSVPGGDKLTFPAAVLCEWHIVAAAVSLLRCNCCIAATAVSLLCCAPDCCASASAGTWHLPAHARTAACV